MEKENKKVNLITHSIVVIILISIVVYGVCSANISKKYQAQVSKYKTDITSLLDSTFTQIYGKDNVKVDKWNENFDTKQKTITISCNIVGYDKTYPCTFKYMKVNKDFIWNNKDEVQAKLLDITTELDKDKKENDEKLAKEKQEKEDAEKTDSIRRQIIVDVKKTIEQMARKQDYLVDIGYFGELQEVSSNEQMDSRVFMYVNSVKLTNKYNRTEKATVKAIYQTDYNGTTFELSGITIE